MSDLENRGPLPAGRAAVDSSSAEETWRDWLPATGPLAVGLTAGASTPNNIVGQVIRRFEEFCGKGRRRRRKRKKKRRRPNTEDSEEVRAA